MASVTDVSTARPGERRGWAQKYPPLLAMAAAVLIALVVLPSSLNLPQTNPTQTLEYAPVPPDEETDDAPDGNFAALGLGSSSGIRGGGAGGGDGAGGGPPPPPPLDGGGAVDASFQCVGNPPRQTRDPLSPPCVPFFEGDNGGATYQGVTANEVRILFYMDGGQKYVEASNPGNQDAPGGQLFDLTESVEQCQQHANNEGDCTHLTMESLRVWQQYFNARFQTYGRFVHFWVYFSNAGDGPQRRADAAMLVEEIEPFAVVSIAEGAENDFLRAMARKGVLTFGSFAVRPKEFFAEYPGRIYSYLPSVEQQVETYATYVCQKVVGHPSVLAEPALNNQPRKIGMVHTTDPNWPGLIRIAELIEERVEQCGGEIVDHATFGGCCTASTGPPDPGDQQKMASFRSQGITTILWTGGISGEQAKAASSIGYFPEWIVLGDTIVDAHHPVRISNSSAALDGHSVLVTPQTYEPALEHQKCFEAFREFNKTYQDSDLQYTCNYYRDLFQLFVGIQVAGPYLGPTQVDKGFHAIPQKYVGAPDVPACFYLPGDYTCVKDATAMYWDAEQNPPGDERPGCWRAIESGRRYAPGQWPPGNIDAQMRGGEPCSGYDHRVTFTAT